MSHGDFVVIDEFGALLSGLHGYYPGIIPDHPDRAMPLLTIFPELAAIDIDVVTDLAAVDGYIYMALSGSDGLYLFSARDPSVIPEPTTFALALIGVAAAQLIRRQWS